jgi:hypothetical protein
VRDRRWDHLYDLQKQPVRSYIVARFAEVLAEELRAWPAEGVDWADEAQRARWGEGAASPPRDDVVRLALELARLDLAREFEAEETQLARAAHRLQSPAERAAVHLLVRLVTERCLELKERASGAHLSRADLVEAVDAVERLMFRVTLK